MRDWWEDLLINVAGGVGAALIAAAVIAIAARAAKFWAEEDFRPEVFIKGLLTAATAVVAVVGALAAFIPR